MSRETAETIQHCDKDPGILLRFLDDFIDHSHFRKRDAELRQLLLENQDEIERLQEEIARQHGYSIVSHRLEIYVKPLVKAAKKKTAKKG